MKRVRRRALSGLAPALLMLAACFASGSVRQPRAFTWDRTPYVSFSELARVYRLRAFAGDTPESPGLAGSRRMVFQAGSRRLLMDGVAVWMHQPLTRVRGRWAVEQTDVTGLIDPLLRPGLHLSDAGMRRVLIDPGHGGVDSGTTGFGLEEKTLALEVARRVKDRLEALGFETRLTRDTDAAVSLEDRCAQALAWPADVMISIHFNSSPDTRARGVETYVLSRPGYASTNSRDQRPSNGLSAHPGTRYDGASAVLGFYIQRKTTDRAAAEDRGLRHARFVVIRDAPCPTALVECGFLSNSEEARGFKQSARLDALADGVAIGAGQYLNAVLQSRLASP
jgi:N-acetylmuramoyl-L-alanine amidase